MIRSSTLITLLIACPALADEGPSFDCSKASSGAEELVCASPDLSALDRRLADRFTAAMSAAGALDAGADAAKDELRAMQRGWISGRDECWKAEDEAECVRLSYLSRESELVTQWMLEEPTATTFWTCADNPANEVVTMFFDTELPSVRIERGDSIDTGTLSRTASGSRYDASFGSYIWIKDEEAMFRTADPEGLEMSCVAQ